MADRIECQPALEAGCWISQKVGHVAVRYLVNNYREDNDDNVEYDVDLHNGMDYGIGCNPRREKVIFASVLC